MNVGVPNSVSTYHKMSLEEYQKMSFIPTEENLDKRGLEQGQAAMQSQPQGKRADNAARSITDHDADERKSMSDFEKDPLFPSTSTSPQERAKSHSHNPPEIRRLSGNFNAPTHVEVKRHNETKSPRGFRETIRGWVKRSPPPPTIA